MKRPWHKDSDPRPWMQEKPAFGTTRYNTPEYNTRRWQKLRRLVLTENPLCAMCERMGKVTAATMVDHIVPISKGGQFWDRQNLQGLCTHCHKVKTNKEISKRNKGGAG